MHGDVYLLFASFGMLYKYQFIYTAVFGKIRVRFFLFLSTGFIQETCLKQTHFKYAP